jgi:sugar phosphate isomerase/epimerase
MSPFTEVDVTLHGPYMDLSPGGVDAKVKDVTLERIRKTMDLAALFKPKTIVFHPGYDRWRFEGYRDLWLRNSIEVWKPIAGKAQEIGTTIAIENVFDEGPQTLKNLIEAIDSPNFRFCFDTGHYFLFSKVDDHLPLGDGKMDFEEFFDLLGRVTPRPIFTVEPHKEAHLWSSIRALEKYFS